MIDWLIDVLVYILTFRSGWSIDWLIDRSIVESIDWLIDWLIEGWMDGWMDLLWDCSIDWLIDWLFFYAELPVGDVPDAPPAILPNHKQAVLVFLERVYGVQDPDLFFRLLEGTFLADLRAATMMDGVKIEMRNRKVQNGNFKRSKNQNQSENWKFFDWFF